MENLMTNEEIDIFKNILLDRKEQIIKNIQEFKSEIGELQKSEASDEADFATISSDSAIEEAISKKQKKEYEEIVYALKKIEDGTYGICEMCEEEIGIERLKVKPQARYCIVCREIVEKSA
jgi:DnaK suppressor protein